MHGPHDDLGRALCKRTELSRRPTTACSPVPARSTQQRAFGAALSLPGRVPGFIAGVQASACVHRCKYSGARRPSPAWRCHLHEARKVAKRSRPVHGISSRSCEQLAFHAESFKHQDASRKCIGESRYFRVAFSATRRSAHRPSASTPDTLS